MTRLKLTDLGQEIFNTRYAYPGETKWSERAKIVARAVASAEPDDDKAKYEKVFHDAIADGDFVPGGRIIYGAGRNAGKHNLLNCYVISPEDSVGSIGKTLDDMYNISCAGGGIGFNVSKIRPKGDDISNVKNSAPGAVSFLKMINEVGEHVKSGKARRTALIGILNVTHPDLLDFLHVKLDEGELTNFNISVGITDRFVEAVQLDEDWYFTFNNREYYNYVLQATTNKGVQRYLNVIALDEDDAIERAKGFHLQDWSETFEFVKKENIKAKWIWEKIWTNSVNSGDPGVYNIDLANRHTNTSYFESLDSTNPCLKKGSLVLTPDGYKKVEDFKVGDEITTVEGIDRPIQEIEKHENFPVFKVTFSDGSEQSCTLAHKFYAVKGTGVNQFWEQLSLKDLEVGDTVRVATGQMPNNKVPNKPSKYSDREYGFILGTVLGDGCFTEKSKGLKLSSNIEEVEWNSLLEDVFGETTKEYYYDSRGRQTKAVTLNYGSTSEVVHLLEKSSIPKCKAIYKYIPLEYINTNKQFLSGLLDGLFSTDGTVNLKGSLPHIRFCSGSKRLATDVKRILLLFGIHARMYEQERKEHTYDGRKIKSNSPKYDVWVNASNIVTFHNNIKLSHPEKREKIKKAVIFGKLGTNTHRTKIKKIEQDGFADVYDLYEPITDTWISEGIVSQGCGEIPLPSYGNCCLGNVNLSNMVTEDGEVDWPKLAKTVRTGVRFLDNVLTINHFPIPKCQEVGHNSRRIGLGVLGLHYMLIKLSLRYGSEKCLEFLERLFSTIRDEAYKTSIYLARDKQPFPAFDRDKYMKEGFSKTLPIRIRHYLRKYGIRNAVLLTVPPTGTISMLMGVSSGIEPIFSAMYKRRYRQGNVWKETLVVDPLFQKYHNEGKELGAFVGAYDITPEDHMRVQATIQHYIDSALSKTINLPEDFESSDLINQALDFMPYMKGLTIYRAGSHGNEPLQAIPLTKENVDKYMQQIKEVVTADGQACSLTGGGCGD